MKRMNRRYVLMGIWTLLLMFMIPVAVGAAAPPVVTFETNGGTAVQDYTLTNDTYVFDRSLPTVSYYRMEDVVVGDLDGDGDEDLVVSGWGDSLLVYEQDANDLLSYIDIDSSVLALDTIIDDFTNDATNDILLMERPELNLYEHDGLFGFTKTTLYDPTPDLTAMAVGDLNGDLDLDIVVANGDYEVVQILSDGTGGFLSPEVLTIGAGYISHIQIHDVTNDGINDIIFNRSNSGDELKYLEGDGDGTYVEDINTDYVVNDYVSPFLSEYRFEFTDIDGDGIKDLFVFDNYYGGYGYAYIHINADGSFEDDGLGTVIVNVIEQNYGSNYYYILDDKDGDNDKDLVIYENYSTNPLYIYENIGGVFSSAVSFYTYNHSDILFTDYNSDGNTDLVVASYNNEAVYVYEGTGATGYVLSGVTTPTKTGYNFAGWYTDSGLTNAFDYSTVLSSDITLYAKWTLKTFNVYYHGNGYTSGYTSSQTFEYGVAENLNANGFLRDGYDFAGWNLNSDGSGTSYSDQELVSFERESNLYYLYAQWTLKNYDVVFDANSGAGTMNNQTFAYTTSVALSANMFTKVGYSFAGWNTESDGTGDSYLDGASFTMPIDGDILYAQWTIDSYTLEFVDYDGTVLQTAIFEYGADLSGVTAPADPTRIGYTFDDWGSDVPATMPGYDVTIEAAYLVNSYTLEFEDYDGTVLQTGVFDYEEDLSGVSLPSDPIRVGYTFENWDISVPSTMPDSDVTISAVYSVNTYTITYLNFDDSILYTETFDFDEDLSGIVEPTVPSRSGYTFTGFDVVLPGTMPANNIILIAQFDINSYTATYDVDGVITTETVYYGDGLENYPTPVKAGYEFVEWQLNGLAVELSSLEMPNQDCTFIAIFIDIEAPVIGDLSDMQVLLSDVESFSIPTVTITDNEDDELLAVVTMYKADGVTVLGTLQDVIDELALLHDVILAYNVTDVAGNDADEMTVLITVTDDVAPVVTGITDDTNYPSGSFLVIEFTEGTALLNDESVESGHIVTEAGTYHFVLSDEAGNETVVDFTVEEAPSSSFSMWWLALLVPVVGIPAFYVIKKVF